MQTLLLALADTNGHSFVLFWEPHDMPQAIEEIVNWWRDGLLTRAGAIEMIQSCKALTDAEFERCA
jgi:hypothetical protein